MRGKVRAGEEKYARLIERLMLTMRQRVKARIFNTLGPASCGSKRIDVAE